MLMMSQAQDGGDGNSVEAARRGGPGPVSLSWDGGTLRNDQPGSTLARGLARDVLGGRGLDLRGRQRSGG
jgi:hypothetical protein